MLTCMIKLTRATILMTFHLQYNLLGFYFIMTAIHTVGARTVIYSFYSAWLRAKVPKQLFK